MAEQKLRAVLVGCGTISEVWLKASAEIGGLEVVGFVDLNAENARQRAAEFGAKNGLVSTDLEAALRQTRPDIVFDCTLPSARAQVVQTALAHGCHVLTEKPMADSLETARQLVAAARQAGKLYAVMQNRRYDPNMRRVKAFLDSGRMGALTTLNSDYYMGVHFESFRRQQAHILLLDMAIHTFDAARFLIGANAVSAYCYEWNPAGSWYERDASALAIFEMSNGVVYTYRGSWCAEGLATTWESAWHAVGQRGSLKWDGAENIQAQVVARTDSMLSSFDDVPLAGETPRPFGMGHLENLREFIDCVRNGGQPLTRADDNIHSLAMVCAAIQSADSGQRVPVVA
ncbi:MAG: Gfo/Idh/MocA family oxidoreductase [Chloroflexi bacterium]|nr:Gfo/Idh/MocA family oxidoreductase [Chloroflexota bacterium]